MLLRDSRSQSSANRQFLADSERLWNSHKCSLNEKLESFPKYVSREALTKFLARASIFQAQLDIQGSVVELGVARGASLFTWAQLSSIFEPANYTREVIGFDTFSGIPFVSIEDLRSEGVSDEVRVGGFAVADDMRSNLEAAASLHDSTRFLGHIPKIRLINGAIESTVPAFLEQNPQLVISLLHIDVDIFSATKVALELLLPRVPKGGIVIFDELNDRRFPGETIAVHQVLGIRSLRLNRIPSCPTLCYWFRD